MTIRNENHLAADSIIVRCEGIIDSEVNGEIVALSIEKGTCYGLNKVGARIWKIIVEPSRVRDVCDRLVLEYEVDPSTCEREVLDLLKELLGEGLIKVVPPALASGPSQP
jgi:hypothetical protein